MLPKLPRRFQKLAPVLAPLAAVVVICNAWFLNFSVRTAGDWGYFVKAASDTLRRHYFSIWLSDTQFGRVLIDAGQAPTYAAYGWLSYYLHTGYALNERIVHLWPATIVAVLGSYALVRYIFRDKPAAVLGAIVYSANTYYLALLTGGLTLAVAYAFAPLVVLFYMKAMNGQRVSDIIWCALMLAACGAYEPRVGYIVVFMLMVLAAIHFFCIWQPKNQLLSGKTFRLLVVYAGPIVLFGLLNAYWILGLSHAGGVGGDGIASSLFGNEFFTISTALTLFHPYWTGGQIQPFFVHPIPIYFWLIPLAAFGGLIVSKRTPVVLFFALLGVIGILLTKQSDQPFVGLYHWLFTNLPGFNAFREASKFYLLTALAYAVLLPALYWYVKTHYKRKWLTISCFVVLALLFLPNLIPIATNKIGGTFRPRSIPKQYVQLNKFLDMPGYGRVLWVPQKSRWSFSSVNHPAVSADVLVGTSWKNLADSYASNHNATSTDEINALLSQNYMPALLADAGIKYVIVPMRDLQNEDNFYRNYNDDPAMFARTLAASGYLKEADAHVDGFKIYQTIATPKPYFSSVTRLYNVAGSQQLPAAYNLWQKTLGGSGDFSFALGGNPSGYTTDVADLFGGLSGSNLRSGTLPIAKGNAQKSSNYYFDQNYTEASYAASPGSISFQTSSLSTPGSSSTQKPSVTTMPLKSSSSYVLKTGTDIEPVARNLAQTYIGSPRSDTDLYEIASANLVPAPTISGALWRKDADNCVPYGIGDPSVRAVAAEDSDLNKPVIDLMADDHAACTGPPALPVQAGETYMLQFRYHGFDAQFAGYELTYNTPDHQTVTDDIPLADDVWHTYQTSVTVPSGATNVTIQLLARPSNQMKDIVVTSYTDLSFTHLRKVTTFKSATGVITPAKTTTATLQAVPYKGYPYHNLVPDGSFENGPWKKRVGDCDAYDNSPAIRMSLTKHQTSDGTHALQLEAKRHIACTNTDQIPVQGGGTYLLEFDYQSPNAEDADFAISFDDRNATRLNRAVPIKDTAWHTYSQIISVPPDAHNLTLAIFAYSGADQSNYIVNRYDDFVLQRVPDVQDRFYEVSDPTTTLAGPQKIAYQDVSSTYKKVTVTGAAKPFLLLMSEQYHPGWQIVLGNAAESRSRLYLPWKAQPELADQDHVQANGFENAWYIDPQAVCKAAASACTQNPDGSYNLHFGVQFSAQRWFNLGMIISGATGLVCVGALVFLKIEKRRRLARHERKVHENGTKHTA